MKGPGKCLPKRSKKRCAYTYADYLNFPDDLRCEIIDGQIYDMTPAPTPAHQNVTGQIYGLIWDRLRKQEHACRVFVAPLDVVVAEDQVVQPDVFVVCDRPKIEKTHIAGAPDVVFETASPSTSLKDRREKMELYDRSGVAEYFIIEPDAGFIEKYMPLDGRYARAGIYAGDALFCIDTISLELTAKDLFTE